MKPVISKTDPIGCKGSCARTSATNQSPVTARHAIHIALARCHVARARFAAAAVVISLLLLVHVVADQSRVASAEQPRCQQTAERRFCPDPSSSRCLRGSG